MNMRGIVCVFVALLTTMECRKNREGSADEEEVEHEIHEAFKAAFSNRSDEIQDFFNKTFGPGGNASDVAERFKQAWGSTSDGVKRFVNETYWNISRIMSGNDSISESESASLSYAAITEKINDYESLVKDQVHPTSVKQEQAHDKPDQTHGGVLDTAWNYFKSVFGVNPKPTPRKTVPNKVVPPSASNSAALGPPPVDHHGGLYVGLIAMFAALFVLLQSIFNKNSLATKQVTIHSKTSWPYQPKSQVPSGYSIMSPVLLKGGVFALLSAKFLHYAVSSKTANTTTKLINTLVVLYSSILVFGLIFSSRQSVLDFISTILGGGTPLPEKDYGDVCTIYVPNHPSGDPFFNVSDRIDVFVLAHSIGWFIKTLILRDVKTAWICSILFEIIELCFAHLLPNFNECWWDSVIMDVFGCNMIGIHSADLVLTMIGAKKFDFFDRALFTNRSRRKLTTSINYKAMFSVCLMTLLISLIDLNFFFLKFVLYFPTTHWVCFIRTLLWVLISIPGAIELYYWSSTTATLSKISDCRSCVIGGIGLVTEIIFYTIFRGESFMNSGPTPLPTFLLIVSIVYATCWSGLRT